MLYKAEKDGRIRLIEERQVQQHEASGWKITNPSTKPLEAKTTYIKIPPGAMALIKDGDYRFVPPHLVQRFVKKGWEEVDEATLNGKPAKKAEQKIEAVEAKIEEVAQDEGDMDMMKRKIRELLANIDHDNKEHWTAVGLPNTFWVRKALGDRTITRAMIDEAVPGLTRKQGEE